MPMRMPTSVTAETNQRRICVSNSLRSMLRRHVLPLSILMPHARCREDVHVNLRFSRRLITFMRSRENPPCVLERVIGSSPTVASLKILRTRQTPGKEYKHRHEEIPSLGCGHCASSRRSVVMYSGYIRILPACAITLDNVGAWLTFQEINTYRP